MMRFWKNLSQPSQFVSRSKVFTGPLVIGLLLISGTASGFQANSSPQDTAQNFSAGQQASINTTAVQQNKISESRIAELRAFAKAHHPEIMPLLDFLQQKRTKKFNKVIKGLDRDVSNLERLKKRSDEAYERGLAMWVNQSRVQLYAAQFKVAADDKTAAELKEKIRLLIEENLDARVTQMARDQEKLEARLVRLRKGIEEIKTNRDALIAKKIQYATRSAPKMNTGENLNSVKDRKRSATPQANPEK